MRGRIVSSPVRVMLALISDDADGLDGMPVGLQIIVPRHEEELAIKLGGVVMDAIGKGAKRT